MERRTAIVAAIPLAIAIAGASMLPNDRGSGDRTNVRSRTAVTANAIDIDRLNISDDQREWVKAHNPFGIPVSPIPADRTLIIREGYTLAHNDVDLIADWVSFNLTKDFVNGTEARPGTSAFKPDPVLIRGRRAELDDYKGFKGTYDRGHQAANADSKGRGKRVIRESFLLSNMTPQSSNLNQVRWRLFEKRVQDIAKARGEVFVVTGPLFVDQDGDGTVEYFVIGDNEVAVPTHYFKIVLAKDKTSKEWESMTVIVPNEPTKNKFDIFLRSIDEVERLSALDFFPDMPKEDQKELEKAVADELWEADG